MESVSEFTAEIGVNTHIDETTTAYGNVSLVDSALSYLGISLIRDHAFNIDVPAFQTLAASGVRFDLITDGVDPGSELNDVASLLGSVVSFEGADEVDIYPVEAAATGNVDQVTAAISEQQALYAAEKVSPFSAVPVINESVGYPSDYAAYAASLASSDVTNVHAYAGSDPPMATLVSTLQIENIAPNKPVEVTETGYFTLPSDPNGVDEATQAKYTLDTLFDDASLGVSATFLYELLDEGSDPAGNNSQLHYGLFNADGTPKLAATAIHNLTAVLALPGPAGAPALTLTPTVSGLPDTGNWLQLAGNGGAAVIAVWAEPAAWDPVAQQDIVTPPSSVTVDLGAVAASVSVYDPLLGTAAIATYADVSSVTLGITDHPLIIEAANAVPVVQPSSATTTASSTVSPSTDATSPSVEATSPGVDTTSVYRYFDSTTGTHFFTDSASEEATIAATRPDLVNEGVAWQAIDPGSSDPNAAPVYRFFDSTYGTHFYTASASERDTVVATRPDLVFEGIGFYEDTSPQPGDVPVYRFFDSEYGTHFYTASATEEATILATRPDLISEGIGFYAPSA